KEIEPRQVGRELGVRAVLTGRLIQRGDRLALQVDLVETGEGSQLWGERYDRKASGLLAVKQELAREISERLRLRLGVEDEERLTRGDAANTEAYQLYLRGRHFWNKTTAEGMKKAIDYFQQAIEKDPNYALAYVGLADSYGVLELYSSIPSSETLPNARAAVERALQIDPLLAEAHASLGNIEMYSWNFDKAEREVRQAIELNPNYLTAHFFYGYYLRQIRGSYDEAIAEFRWAQRLDPLSPLIGQNIAAAHKCKGELSAAIEEAKKVIELDPSFPAAYFPLGNAYRKQGRYDEAIAALEKSVELSERWSISLGYLGVSYAVAGKRERARAILKELKEKYVRGEALGQSIAVVYAALGEKEQAFAWLEKDFQVRSGPLPFAAHDTVSDKTRDALASDPRWQDLLRRIGLPQD
ncbi:MAG TPA: tetratricopeptide repeat protein, partial [Blastocatellia bacterium]|nr:tetratricopeptide repeat protein [Blastocatellia bacterium]